ncbi:DUF1183 domain-containing protein [Histoplasma capsulatum H143]|uniref:Store-operated calcium entry-associated regulatory factor n=1 Tax=Ajellomyces capsulatus (strain H143) TaxID=544712 RepID=C6HHW7_AJECH|nr:DUF1183 domain-containing protein [Histoplasma capsulatum H143]
MTRIYTTIVPLLSVLLSLLPAQAQAYKPSRAPASKDAVLLSAIQSLTFHSNRKTTHRRLPAVEQLTCIGPSKKICALYTPDTMRCVNQGHDYDVNDVQWTCTAHLPPEFRLGSTDVVCEGYRDKEDPWVLKGSCGVEYRLLLTERGEQRYGELVGGYGNLAELDRGEAAGHGGAGEVEGALEAVEAEDGEDGEDGMIRHPHMNIRDLGRCHRGRLGFGLVQRRGARRHMLWAGGVGRNQDLGGDGDRTEQKAQEQDILGRHFHPLLQRRKVLDLAVLGGVHLYAYVFMGFNIPWNGTQGEYHVTHCFLPSDKIDLISSDIVLHFNFAAYIQYQYETSLWLASNYALRYGIVYPSVPDAPLEWQALQVCPRCAPRHSPPS